MCGLAEVLHNMGAQVSGSDLSDNAQVQRLRQLGLAISLGHRAEAVHGAEVVVTSSAVPRNNPEVVEARRLKIPLIPRAEALAEIMRLKRGLAIGGSHGKTTTTSLAASIFLHGGLNPTIVVGGRLDLIKSTALLGSGEWLVAEADESDGSFLRLSPEIVVITNIDNDHLDHYGTMAQLQKAYFDFAMRTPFFGLAIVCGDDPLIRETFRDFGKRIVTYGFEPHNDVTLSGQNGIYEIRREGQRLGEIQLQLSGRHNALNAVAALIAGLEAGLSFSQCAQGLFQFQGVDRRLQFKGAKQSIDVYDDYGHHPTEVRAVLAAVRERFPDRRIVAAFQPHRYSRTKLCWDQFMDCFAGADELFILDIYAAGEEPIPGVSSESFLEGVARARGVRPTRPLRGDLEARAAELVKHLNRQDVVLTLGAGDVWKLGLEVLNQIDEPSSRRK